MREFLDSLPDITAQQAAFLACGCFVVPPLALLAWEEHVSPHLRRLISLALIRRR